MELLSILPIAAASILFWSGAIDSVWGSLISIPGTYIAFMIFPYPPYKSGSRFVRDVLLLCLVSFLFSLLFFNLMPKIDIYLYTLIFAVVFYYANYRAKRALDYARSKIEP